MYPLGGPRLVNLLENAIHLGLMAFLPTFIRGLDGKVSNNTLLAGLVMSSSKALSQDMHVNSEVLPWLLFIGKASVFGDADDDTWLAQEISLTMHTRGLKL